MSAVTFEVFAVLLLILLNSLFSLSELAVVSSRRVRLEQMSRDGNRGAQAALELAESPNRFLSTVQIGITLIGILTGAFGGATLAGQLSIVMADLPIVGPYAETISLFLVVAVITFLSVVVGELVPKRLALLYPETLASYLARPMKAISRLGDPLVRLLSAATDGILRLFGVKPGRAAGLTEEEIRLLVEQGAMAGVIEEVERDMVESVFRLGDRPVRSLMTARPEIVWLDVNATEADIRRSLAESRHSMFPVCDGSLDEVVGVVAARDLLARCLEDQSLAVGELMQPPVLLPGTIPSLGALERLKATGMHMALLFDEYGGIVGLVTLIDLLEAIVGDIPTQDEMREPPIVRRADGSWLVDGLLTPDELREFFEFEALPDEESYQTLGGLMLHMIGRIPISGDYFGWDGFRFEVVDMDNTRVDKVLISRLPED